MNDLIARLEAIKADIPATSLSTPEYQEVGWAIRPLRSLIDTCRREIALAREESPLLKHIDGKILISRAGVVRLRAMGLSPQEIAQRLDVKLPLVERCLRTPSSVVKCGAQPEAPGEKDSA